jgi:hypothetical protein
MARTPAKPTKSETLTIRLDPKTRFILDYVSRLKGQTITTVIERAVVQAASKETIQVVEGIEDLIWQDIWDVSEGARALNLAQHSEFFPSYEEERRLSFCKEHWTFFFTNEMKNRYRLPLLNILWGRIDEFIEIHEKTKSGGEYWAAGKAMQSALVDAGIEPPKWPIEKSTPSASTSSNGEGKPEDDEIPF